MHLVSHDGHLLHASAECTIVAEHSRCQYTATAIPGTSHCCTLQPAHVHMLASSELLEAVHPSSTCCSGYTQVFTCGPSPAGVSAIPWLGYCTPISNSRTRHPQQQQRDMQELQQWQHSRTLDWSACTTAQQQQWFAAGPKFARSAAEIALLLLSAPDLHDRNRPDVLSQWLKSAIRPASSQPDLERAKAVVAAVAAAPVIPTGAQVLEREAFRQVVLSGDVDLIAVVLCWADRLEVLPEDDNNVGDQAAAEGILIEAGWVPGMQGADGQPLPVLIPGEEDEAEDV